jgi:DNA-binding GntR family transcriptional regulator
VLALDRPKTLTDAVVDHIREAVLRGELAPGQQLREIPLSRTLETSRGTVREALRALQDEGLVKIVAHRGAVVTELSPQRVHEIFDLRALLEPHAVELALADGPLDADALQAIRRTFDELCAAVRKEDDFEVIHADMDFHGTLAAPCRHELLLEHLAQLRLQTRQAIFYTKLYASDREGEAEAHAPIVEAVVAGDPVRAARVVRDHIVSAGEQLLARMKESDSA